MKIYRRKTISWDKNGTINILALDALCLVLSEMQKNFMHKAVNYSIIHIIKRLEITKVSNHRGIVKYIMSNCCGI